MKSTGHRELDALIARTQQASGQFAVLQWTVKVSYHSTAQEARHAMAPVPESRRMAIVDRETGETWVARENYRPMMATLRHKGTAPEHFRRMGPLDLTNRKPKLKLK